MREYFLFALAFKTANTAFRASEAVATLPVPHFYREGL